MTAWTAGATVLTTVSTGAVNVCRTAGTPVVIGVIGMTCGGSIGVTVNSGIWKNAANASTARATASSAVWTGKAIVFRRVWTGKAIA